MAHVKAKINPIILKWWREELNLDISLVAERLGKNINVLESWENWEDYPTMKQLEKIANVYKTHISVFYLFDKPEKLKPKINYRGIEITINPETRYRLEMNIAEAVQRKNIATELYDALWITPKALPKIDISLWVEKVAEIIRNFLWPKSPINTMTFSWKSSYEILKFWKNCIEDKDIIVSQTSVNTHLGLDVSVIRGFCIAKEWIPIIVLNSKDSPLWKIFTILHELTHILIWWDSEIQNIDFRNINNPYLDVEEIFCNRVAAEILVPKKSFLQIINNTEFELSKEFLVKTAKWYWVSEEVIMRRLLDFGRITNTSYEKFRTENRIKWEESQSSKSSNIIVPYYRRVLGANWYLFTRLTLLAYQSEKINLLNVGQFLNANLNHLPKIESELYWYAK